MKYSPGTSLLHRLHRASQTASERLFVELSDSSLTERQVVVLASINENQGGSQTDIVNATGVDRSTLADIARRLTKRGLVTRKRTKQDARAYAVTLTKEGRRALDIAGPIMAKVEAGMLAGLTIDQRNTLAQALEAMVMYPDASAQRE
jgi:DNA-binding MarR family transcriptional regulator